MKFFLTLFLFINFLIANVPQKISYQGTLFDNEDNLIEDGNYKIKFILYENNFGGVGLWEESHIIQIQSGLISVILGSINPITISEKINYLEIHVEDQILVPRQELTSVVYSFHSKTSIKSIKSDTSNFSIKSIKSDTSNFSIKSIKSDTSNFSLNSNSSVKTSSLLLGTSSISLPSADGSSGQVLSTNGSGSLSWSTINNNNNNNATSLNDLSDATVGSGSKLISSTGGGDAQYNVGLGYEVFNAINTGDYNTGIGSNTLGKLTTGSDNTTIGRDAAELMTTGSNNIIIGSEADPSSNNAVNQIVIGKGAVGHGDNITVIGNGSQTAIHPHDNNEVDLGSSSYQFKDIHIDGTAHLDAIGMGNSSISLPSADGSSGQVLSTNGSGSLSWTNVTDSYSLLSSNTDYNFSTNSTGGIYTITNLMNAKQILLPEATSSNVGISFEFYFAQQVIDLKIGVSSSGNTEIMGGIGRFATIRDGGKIGHIASGEKNIFLSSNDTRSCGGEKGSYYKFIYVGNNLIILNGYGIVSGSLSNSTFNGFSTNGL